MSEKITSQAVVTIPEVATPVDLAPVPANMAGLRTALFEQLNMLRQGTISAKVANATSSTCGQILASAKVELATHRFLRDSAGAEKALPALAQLIESEEVQN